MAEIIDFAAWRAKRAAEEYRSWARRFAMECGLDVDFEDPDFWDEVEALIREEYDL